MASTTAAAKAGDTDAGIRTQVLPAGPSKIRDAESHLSPHRRRLSKAGGCKAGDDAHNGWSGSVREKRGPIVPFIGGGKAG